MAFNDVGHSKDAREMLKDYYIGDLEKVSFKSGSLLITLKVARSPLLGDKAEEARWR